MKGAGTSIWPREIQCIENRTIQQSESDILTIKLQPGLYMATFLMRNHGVDSNACKVHLLHMAHGASKLRPISWLALWTLVA